MTHERKEPQGVPPTSLSARIERLFEVNRPSGEPERRYTNREVVTACKTEGLDLSESHLSELRRGVKQNPTLRTLHAIAWFFQVREGYFSDSSAAEEVEHELDERERALQRRLEEKRQAQDELRAASAELQRAMRESGVTKTAHRGVHNASQAREQASMMRALARALVEDDDEEDETPRS